MGVYLSESDLDCTAYAVPSFNPNEGLFCLMNSFLHTCYSLYLINMDFNQNCKMTRIPEFKIIQGEKTDKQSRKR